MGNVGLIEIVFLLACCVSLGVKATNLYQSGQFEGDIILDNATIERMVKGGLSTDFYNAGVASDDKKFTWKHRTVHYIYDSTIENSVKVLIQAAMQEISTATCLGFSPRDKEKDYIIFTKGQGCTSFVGRKGGGQAISLGTGCNTKGIILHEIMHALGFFHTHTRPDRDSYIRIIYSNINNNDRKHFNKYSASQVTTQQSPYDFGSILHPRNNEFAINTQQNTIEARMNSSIQLGQVLQLTVLDIQIINDLYKCGIPGCYHALVGYDTLKNNRMSSSSNIEWFDAHEARLHNSVNNKGLGSWCAGTDDVNQWLEMDFHTDVEIRAIATQGRGISFNPYHNPAYVTGFQLEYFDSNTNSWSQYAQNLPGNFDKSSVMYTELDPAINGRYIRIKPLTWQEHICMRVELYGC